MQKTVEYTANGVSPATVELLIRERSKGKSLRQLGQMFDRSGERIRQVLAKHPSPVTLVSENKAATKLGYPVCWLAKLRKEGLINPTKPGKCWLYSEEQVGQIPALSAEARKCEECSNPRPRGSVRFCKECGQERRKKSLARSQRKFRAKQGREAVIADDRGVMCPGIKDGIAPEGKCLT